MDLTGYAVLGWLFDGGEPVEAPCVPVHQTFDEDGDGRVEREIRTTYDAQMRPVQRTTRGDGKRVETWKRHQAGRWIVTEHDADGDGATDDISRHAWEGGHLVAEEYDRDADGTVDAWVTTTWADDHKVHSVEREANDIGWDLRWEWRDDRLVHLTADVRLDTPWHFEERWSYDDRGRPIARDVATSRQEAQQTPAFHIEQRWGAPDVRALPVTLSVDKDSDGSVDLRLVQTRNRYDAVVSSITESPSGSRSGGAETTAWRCRGELRRPN
jgi:hypothetical protein